MEQEDKRGQYLAAMMTHVFPATRYEDGTIDIKTPQGLFWYYISDNVKWFAHLPVKPGTHGATAMLSESFEDIAEAMANGSIQIVTPTWIKQKSKELMRTDPGSSGIAALRDLTSAAEELYK